MVFQTLSWLCIGGIALGMPLTAQQFSGVTTAFIPHPTDSAKRVEFLCAKPNGTGPWPMLVFVHGHQVGSRVGGSVYVTQGTLQRIAERGIVAVAVSQPGYGQSDGPPDYAGPTTQAAIAAVIERMRQESYVMRDRVGLFGYSRGAIAAAMVATRITDLKIVILGAGIHDLQDRINRLDRSVPQLAGIAENIEREAGNSAQAFETGQCFRSLTESKQPLCCSMVRGTIDLP